MDKKHDTDIYEKTLESLLKTVTVNATGNPWVPDKKGKATVPIPLPVIITAIKGPYTEKDRKLWTFLVHAVWDEIGKTRTHELDIQRINKVFRNLGGEHGTKWIWESATRLMQTLVEWEGADNDKRCQGMVALLAFVLLSKEAEKEGILEFRFDESLETIIKAPIRFARLRTHFMLSLSGKYAVTLYEILESIVNMRNPVLEVDISTLRQWLKVPEGKLLNYSNFNQRVIGPAIKQINDNPEGAGFTVSVKPIKNKRAVVKLRFTLQKTQKRIEKELELVKKQSGPQEPLALPSLKLKTETYAKAKKVAPYFDIYELEQQWLDWLRTKEQPTNPDAAFVAFCKNKQQRINN